MSDFKNKLDNFKGQLRAEKEIVKLQKMVEINSISLKAKEVQLNINIPKILRTKLKIIATEKDVELKKMITDLLLQYVDDNEKR